MSSPTQAARQPDLRPGAVPVADLRAHPLFVGLSDDQYEWLSRAGTLRVLVDGERLFGQGDAARYFIALLEGELLITVNVDGREEAIGRDSTRPDAELHDGKPAIANWFMGELPMLSNDVHIATATSVGTTRVALFDRPAFLRMIERAPQVCQVLLPVLAWRIQYQAAQAGQRNALNALGTLAAGVAHELNNPIAAVTRAIGELEVALPDLERRAEEWGRGADDDSRAAWREVRAEWLRRSRERGRHDALEASELEDDLADWLADHGMADGSTLASLAVDRGLDVEWLAGLADRVGDDVLPAGLEYLSRAIEVRSHVAEIHEAGVRVAGIVRSTKEYTNLDRALEREIDVTQGIEATLTMLQAKLAGITVVRDYDPDTPAVMGYPTELNQVWTNLIDNAADALSGKGELRISVKPDSGCVMVEVADSGPGIPDDVLPRLFDPFFTTKDVGNGTGLGLHLVHRIVTQRHSGSISVRTEPGNTRFRVRLPIEGPADTVSCQIPSHGGGSSDADVQSS